MDSQVLFDARARVLADLAARRTATAEAVSILEDAISSRTWWAEQWPEGVVYVAAVREEYAHVPDDLFAAGRSAVLGDLLAKPHLFHTPYARASWEAAARANVEAELSALSGAGVPTPPAD